jgi:hypothetical protein
VKMSVARTVGLLLLILGIGLLAGGIIFFRAKRTQRLRGVWD